MADNLFADIHYTLFEDKSVLSEEYSPDAIVERDEEIEAFKNALKDVLFGRNPSNIFIYGKTGVGKTAVTEYMMNALSQEVKQRPEADQLSTYFHNCNDDSAYQTIRVLINTIRESSADPFPKTGISTSQALETLYSEMDTRGGTFLFVLDEIDHLSNPDSILYELPRARANGHISNARVGVIGISNNYAFRSTLNPKVKDTLMEKEIAFSPYEAAELRSILTNRAEKALVEGAYDESAIALCAAIAAKDTGSARQVIDLLREAGDIAEECGDETITDDHVEEAIERVRRGRVRDRICDQTTHGQLVLEAVATLEVTDHSNVRSKSIKTVYDRIAVGWGYEPLTTLKSVQNHLSDLTMLGFLERSERNQGRSGGLHYEYETTLDGETILEIRESIESKKY